MVVEREKEIRAFCPSEYWSVDGYFAMSPADGERLAPEFAKVMAHRDQHGGTLLQAEQAVKATGGKGNFVLLEGQSGHGGSPHVGCEPRSWRHGVAAIQAAVPISDAAISALNARRR